MKRRNKLDVEFLRSRSEESDTGCWNWIGDKAQRYPRACIYGISKLVSHWVLDLKGEPRDTNLVAMHSCDNPRCVNPNHISRGSHSDNALDSVKKGRFGGLKKRGLETRKRMSRARLGAVMSQVTKDKLSDIWRAKREAK